MTQERIRHLPVVESGRLVGIVSIGDLLLAGQRVVDRENGHLREYNSGGTRTL